MRMQNEAETIRELETYRDSLDGRFKAEIKEYDTKIYYRKLAKLGITWNNTVSGRHKDFAAVQLQAYAAKQGDEISLEQCLTVIDIMTKGLRKGKQHLVYQSPEELCELYDSYTLEELKTQESATQMAIAFKQANNAANKKANYKPRKNQKNIISPEGTSYWTNNLTKFCGEHDLSYQAMKKVCNPNHKQRTHKGWSCKY